MKKKRFSISLFSLFLVLFIPASILWPGENLLAQEGLRSQMSLHLKQGVQKGFNLDEQGAVAEITRAIELDRENPLGYSFLAMNYLFFYETSFDAKEKKKRENSMLGMLAEAYARAEKRIEKNPRDGEAYFAMAIAKLTRNRWEIIRKKYFNAFRESQNIWDYLEKVRELDPGNNDVYFLMGVLHYHLDHLPGFTRFLTSLVLTTGDKEKGLQELQLASQKGDFLKDLARAELISVYAGYEKQPARVLSLARELKEKFPNNYNLSFALSNILSDLSFSAEAFTLSQEIENGILSGRAPYAPQLWPRYFQLMGKIYLDAGDYEKAIPYFQRALQDEAPYNARVRAWALVRLGMIHDARKERKLAEEYYQKALDVEGGEGVAQVTARQYLQTPYSPKVKEGNKEIAR